MRTVRGLLGLALMVLVAHCGGGDAPSAVGASGGGEDAGGGGDGAVGPTTGDDAATNNSDGGAGTDAAGNRDASDASDAALDGGGDADAGPPPIVTGSAYAHDQGGRLIGEYDEDGRPLEELIYLEDRVVATVRSGKAFAVQTDQLGAPRTVLADNAPVWSWDPEPFGATPPNEDVDGDGKKFVFDQRFPGQRFDAVTGLHQNFHRNYAPEWARYLEADPIGLAGGMNLYGYVGGNPVGQFDPEGLEGLGGPPAIGVAFQQYVQQMGQPSQPGNVGSIARSRTPYTGPGTALVNNMVVGPTMATLNAFGVDNEPPAGCQGQADVLSGLMSRDPRFKGWTFTPVTNKPRDTWTNWLPFSGYHWVVKATSPTGKRYFLDPNQATWSEWQKEHDQFRYATQCPTCN